MTTKITDESEAIWAACEAAEEFYALHACPCEVGSCVGELPKNCKYYFTQKLHEKLTLDLETDDDGN